MPGIETVKTIEMKKAGGTKVAGSMSGTTKASRHAAVYGIRQKSTATACGRSETHRLIRFVSESKTPEGRVDRSL